MGTGRVLVTGAGGFVGRRLVPSLSRTGFDVRRAVRHSEADLGDAVGVGDFKDVAALERACRGVDVVCHLAARAHVVDASPRESLRLFREANVDVTARLAGAAFRSGVRRFVLVSSIGAVGASSQPGRPLDERMAPSPSSPYGLSKLEAESMVRDAAASAGAEWTVVRPPLVHGAGAPGNLARLAQWIDRGRPLPFGSVDNRRSLVHVDTLCRLLVACCEQPAAAGQTFHVRDPRDRSTPEIIRELAKSRGRSARLWNCPPAWLRSLARLSGRRASLEQLTGWLQVDDTRVRTVLRFVPIDTQVIV